MSSTDPEFAGYHKKLFELGLDLRRKVVGNDYVDNALAGGSSEFARPMQELVTQYCWGEVWTRPGLEHKLRSLLNIGILCALNRGPELHGHIRGGINNGLKPIEIREAILQVAVYCGMPAGLEGFKIAETVIRQMIAKGEYRPEKGEYE